MQDYEEKRASLITLVTRTQGINSQAAAGVVATMMKELPAWREHV